MMNAYQNLKIKTKLLLSFAIVIIMAAFISIISIYSLRNLDGTYTNLLEHAEKRYTILLEADVYLVELRRNCATATNYVGDASKITSTRTSADSAYQSLIGKIQEYDNNVNTDNTLDSNGRSSRLQRSGTLKSLVDKYYTTTVKTVFEEISIGDTVAVAQTITNGADIIDEMMSTMDSLIGTTQVTRDEINDACTVTANNTTWLVLGIALALVVISLAIAFGVASIISKPIIALVDAARNIAAGNLNVNIKVDQKDEVGDLAKSFSEVVQNINNLILDIEHMYKDHEDGQMDTHINSNVYKGSYKNVAVGVNDMVDSYIAMLNDIFNMLKAIGKGNFDEKLQIYKGQKSIVNQEVDNMIGIIRAIAGEINTLAKAGAEGKLTQRADVTQFVGQWSDILKGLNSVMNAVAQPIGEAQSVIVSLSKGNFTNKMNGNYSGDFAQIKTALNGTVDAISSYINEINDVLGKMSQGDLTVNIGRDYVGQFASIKDSINTISQSLNNTMAEINASSDQVLTGAKQISQSAMMLAEGATEQASSVQELTATVEEINKQTQDNSNNAQFASTMSDKSKTTAESGNSEMKMLLEAMEGIKTSSNKISNIIKVIEEIATQTNLLALNAAVEAARAGEHGKGFTVVAGAVRDLAVQSQAAAKETTELIQESIERVNDGTQRANVTASSLEQIVDNATEVSGVISKIYDASIRQSEAIGNVSIGLNQISQVVQSNSATSQESAAASEELNSQAETLQSMVAYFKVK